VTLIDRYIARQFLINCVALFVILATFVLVIDVSVNIDRFVRYAVSALEAEGITEPDRAQTAVRTVYLVWDLWWPRLLQLFNILAGMVLVGAMGFTCSQLVRNRELVALMAAGQSLHRVVRPIVLVGVAVTALQAINAEAVVPRIAPLILRDHGEAGEALREGLPLTADAQRRVWRAVSFDAASAEMRGVTVLERADGPLAERRIDADRAVWDPAGEAWVLQNPIIEDRSGAPQPRTQDTLRVSTSLSPDAIRLRVFKRYQNLLSIGQVSTMLRQDETSTPESRARLQRIMWGRISVMFCNVLTLLIAVPFFVTREPRPVVLQALKCAPITVGALVLGVVGSSTEIPGVPPGLGAFVPVLVLLPAAIASLSAMKT